MEKKQATGSIARREFLKTAGIAGAAAGLAVAAGTGPAQADRAPQDAPKGLGYQETEHVRTYYELARF